MARAKFNPALEQFRGKLDDLVFRKYNQTMVVYRYSDKIKDHVPTPRQKIHREVFKNATEYAKGAMRNAQLKMEYRLKALIAGKGNAYNMAVKDYLNKPVVRKVETYGSRVVITAVDDFRVTRVQTALLNSDYEAIEEGEALLSADGLWRFKIKTVPGDATMQVKVTAWDTPGNSDTKIVIYRPGG